MVDHINYNHFLCSKKFFIPLFIFPNKFFTEISISCRNLNTIEQGSASFLNIESSKM